MNAAGTKSPWPMTFHQTELNGFLKAIILHSNSLCLIFKQNNRFSITPYSN